jgi:hypothetical protein
MCTETNVSQESEEVQARMQRLVEISLLVKPYVLFGYLLQTILVLENEEIGEKNFLFKVKFFSFSYLLHIKMQ